MNIHCSENPIQMKKFISITFALLLGLTFVKAQVEVETETPVGGPVMSLESEVVDYGTIEENGDPLRVVKFTNTGDEPLVIKNARGSCGCTVPTWPKEPIMPGEESTIEIRYATNRIGAINKTVKITTNEGEEPHVIKVIGKVLKKETEESVPASGGGIGGGK